MKPTERMRKVADLAFNKAKEAGHINNLRESVAFKLGWDGYAILCGFQMQPEWVNVANRLPENNKHRLIQIEIPTVGLAFYVAGYDPIYKEWLNPFGDKVEEKVIQWSDIVQPKTK